MRCTVCKYFKSSLGDEYGDPRFEGWCKLKLPPTTHTITNRSLQRGSSCDLGVHILDGVKGAEEETTG